MDQPGVETTKGVRIVAITEALRADVARTADWIRPSAMTDVPRN
jgi:hypothetical protein